MQLLHLAFGPALSLSVAVSGQMVVWCMLPGPHCLLSSRHHCFTSCTLQVLPALLLDLRRTSRMLGAAHSSVLS